MEAVRQGMHEKAPDELVSLERHRFALAALAIILPAEGHTTIGQRDQPAVGNADAEGCSGLDIDSKSSCRLSLDAARPATPPIAGACNRGAAMNEMVLNGLVKRRAQLAGDGSGL